MLPARLFTVVDEHILPLRRVIAVGVERHGEAQLLRLNAAVADEKAHAIGRPALRRHALKVARKALGVVKRIGIQLPFGVAHQKNLAFSHFSPPTIGRYLSNSFS